MPIDNPRMRKVKMEVNRIKGQGIDVQHIIKNLQHLQCELEGHGCKVQIEIEGQILKAGKETRTPDILLGKNSVIVEGEIISVGEVVK